MNPKILAVIPARYASVRFPGKPLAEICGRPMIQWVYESAKTCSQVDHVVVATDDERIFAAAEAFGAQAIMTSSDHETGTDRVGEVASQLDEYDVFVNVQGDQPFVTAESIAALVEPFSDPSVSMSTIACPLNDSSLSDPNSVKVICDRNMNAIYFSRSDIPYRRQQVESLPVYHHLGLYAFSKMFLLEFQKLKPTPLEQSEQLEQLRAIENGFRIRVSLIGEPLIEVNTPEDLVSANQAMAGKIEL